MKKLFLILGLCMVMIVPLSAKKVVVLQVTKEGDGWQNLFNLYRTVTTTFRYKVGDITYADLDCNGSGYNSCRASYQIGEQSTGSSEADDVLGNAQIVQAINNLIEASEVAYNSKGTLMGAKTIKVAMLRGDRTQLYYVKANWQYRTGSDPQAKITITIETDDYSLIDRKR